MVRAMGYLELDHDCVRLSASGRHYFGPGAPEPYGDFVAFAPTQWQHMARVVERFLSTGKGVDVHSGQSTEEWELYQRAMAENASAFSWFVADNTPVPPGARTCLDIAGSHGIVGAAVARRHPPLRCTVLERKEAIVTAREIRRGARAPEQHRIPRRRPAYRLVRSRRPRRCADVQHLASLFGGHEPEHPRSRSCSAEASGNGGDLRHRDGALQRAARGGCGRFQPVLSRHVHLGLLPRGGLRGLAQRRRLLSRLHRAQRENAVPHARGRDQVSAPPQSRRRPSLPRVLEERSTRRTGESVSAPMGEAEELRFLNGGQATC